MLTQILTFKTKIKKLWLITYVLAFQVSSFQVRQSGSQADTSAPTGSLDGHQVSVVGHDQDDWKQKLIESLPKIVLDDKGIPTYASNNNSSTGQKLAEKITSTSFTTHPPLGLKKEDPVTEDQRKANRDTAEAAFPRKDDNVQHVNGSQLQSGPFCANQERRELYTEILDNPKVSQGNKELALSVLKNAIFKNQDDVPDFRRDLRFFPR